MLVAVSARTGNNLVEVSVGMLYDHGNVVGVAGGGVTANKAKEILYKYLGEDSDDYDEEWGNVPLSITNSPSNGGFDLGALTMAIDGKIQKAASRPEDAQVYAVMKEVRKLLVDLKQQQEGEQ